MNGEKEMKKRKLQKVLALVMTAVTVLSASGNVLTVRAHEEERPETQSAEEMADAAQTAVLQNTTVQPTDAEENEEAAGDVTFGVVSDTHVTAFKSTASWYSSTQW